MLLGSRIIAIFLFLCASLVLVRHRNYSNTPYFRVKPDSQNNHGGCSGRLIRLKDLGIKFPIKYARRDIIIRSNPELDRTSLTQIDASLLPDIQIIDPVKSPNWGLDRCSPPITLEVPAFPKQPANASHIIFGISTYIKRLEDSIPHLQRSIAHSSARLIVLVVEAGDGTPSRKAMTALETRMRGFGVNTTVVGAPKGSTMQARYFSLTKLLYEKRDFET